MKRLNEEEMFKIHFQHEVTEVEYGNYTFVINTKEDKEMEK